MTDQEFYGDVYPVLGMAEQFLLELVAEYPGYGDGSPEYRQIIACQSRIKSADSMMHKLEKRGFEVSRQSALKNAYDAVGIRIICGFFDDVYKVAGWLEENKAIQILQKKDYIAFPKPNGYRSLHLCLRICKGSAAGVHAEIQIRTMAIDFWATLEHQLKYKKEIVHEDLIRKELKRCADEIAATDMSMQTIRDMLELKHEWPAGIQGT
ncbi:MAG: RelA/SpoT domain protein [Lachnospiraceae bacterium]|nr:RelA/SpoT domain protein [Lachnospiraceae bacterium]MCM1561445.1 RelA/SpoT domain protein [Butyrivibrio sp.]